MAKSTCGYVVSTWASYTKDGYKQAHAKTLKLAIHKANAEAKRLRGTYRDARFITVSVEHVCTNPVLRGKRGKGISKRMVRDVYECTSGGTCRKVRGKTRRFLRPKK
jgi:hypothetical protein